MQRRQRSTCVVDGCDDHHRNSQHCDLNDRNTHNGIDHNGGTHYGITHNGITHNGRTHNGGIDHNRRSGFVGRCL